MADAYLFENSDRILLEDGTGVLLLNTPQFMRPDGVGAVGGTWTGSYLDIDETVASDADFLESPLNPTSTEFYTATLTDPGSPDVGSNAPVILRFRASKSAAAGRDIALVVEIRQGDTTVVASLDTGLMPDTYTDYTYTLSPAEVAAITDYNDLRFRFNPTVSGGGAGRAARLSWAELQVPGAGPANLSRSVSDSAPATDIVTRTKVPRGSGFIGEPQSADAGISFETHPWSGPFKDANNNLYVIAEATLANGNRIACFKSTDGGESWTEQNTAARPPNGQTGDTECGWVTQVGAHHLSIVWMDSGGDVKHARFAMSSASSGQDTWTIDENNVFLGSFNFQQVTAAAALSNSDIWALWTNTAGAQYAKRTSGGWGSASSITGATRDAVGMCMGANDLAHIFYVDASGNIQHRSLTSAGTLSAAEQVNDTAVNTVLVPFSNPVYYDDDGVEVITLVWANTSGHLRASRIRNDGTPTAEETVNSTVVSLNPGAGNEEAVVRLAVDAKTVYAVWAQGSDSDVYLQTSDDEGAWSSASEIADGVTCNWLNGVNVYNHGLGRVLAFVIDNNADANELTHDQEYWEFVLGASITKAVGDNAPATDVVSRVASLTRAFSDSAPATDALAALRTFARSATDSAPATDALSYFISRYLDRAVADGGPVQVASDDFNRADTTPSSTALGADWSTTRTSGFLYISGNQVAANASGAWAATVTPTATEHQWAQVKVGALGSSSFELALAWPTSAPADAVDTYRSRLLVLPSGALWLEYIGPGGSIQTVATGVTCAPGDVVRIERSSDRLQAFKNGVLAGTLNPNASSVAVLWRMRGQLKVAIRLNDTTARVDDFSFGDLGVTADLATRALSFKRMPQESVGVLSPLSRSAAGIVQVSIFTLGSLSINVGRGIAAEAAYSGTVDRLRIRWPTVIGSPAGTVIFEVATSLNGAPLASASLAEASIVGNTSNVVAFDTPFAVTAGTTYYVRLRRSGGEDASNHPRIVAYNSAIAQGAGLGLTYSTAGGWVTAAAGVADFSLYVAGSDDAVTRTQAFSRPAADTASAPDALDRQLTQARSVEDSAPATDIVTYEYTPGSGVFDRPVDDTAAAVDTLARSLVLARGPPDDAAAADVVTYARTSTRAAADTAAATDAVARTRTSSRAVADDAAAADAAARTKTLLRNTADTGSADDTTTRILTSTRVISDTALAADTVVGTQYIPLLPETIENDGLCWSPVNAATQVDAINDNDDTDYIKTDTFPCTTRYKLSSYPTPPAGTRTLRMRVGNSGSGTVTYTLNLYEGGGSTFGAGTLRGTASTTRSTAGLVTIEAIVTDPITDYSNLYVEMTAVSP